MALSPPCEQYTYVSPPEIYTEPVESIPSPSALIFIVPPEIVILGVSSVSVKLSLPIGPPKPLWSFPPAEFIPSSVEFMVIFPSAISTKCPSRPS